MNDKNQISKLQEIINKKAEQVLSNKLQIMQKDLQKVIRNCKFIDLEERIKITDIPYPIEKEDETSIYAIFTFLIKQIYNHLLEDTINDITKQFHEKINLTLTKDERIEQIIKKL